MLKDMGYEEKFEILSPWLHEIIELVKKDLKNEHLKIDREFCKKYFLGKNFNHVQVEEMVPAYQKDIKAGNVGLGEFIASRWILKNTDIYGFFEDNLKTISPDFDEIEELNEKDAENLMRDAVSAYGPKKVFLFCILNSVVFPTAVVDKLKQLADKDTQEKRTQEEEQKNKETIESMQKRHSREIAAMEDRYEKKISGLQKKYLTDMHSLKKQISTLQKKLNEMSEK